MSVFVPESIQGVCLLMVELDVGFNHFVVLLGLLLDLFVILLACVDEAKWVEIAIVSYHVEAIEVVIFLNVNLNLMTLLIIQTIKRNI